MVDITVYENIEEFLEKHGEDDLWLTTTKAPKIYTEAKLNDGCYILFGKETAGLPLWLRERYRDRCVRLPMREDARSLNLSNTAAVMCYEALRQQGFPNLKELGEMASNFN
jgi:tRNA (cytidine/uridine-2'-O-)-methyltransferase